jgi:hypothetical protein
MLPARRHQSHLHHSEEPETRGSLLSSLVSLKNRRDGDLRPPKNEP